MLRRLETMILMTGYELPLRAIREQIASAVDLIVHTARLKDGSRKIVNITEVYGIDDDEILLQDIFAFQQTGIDETGRSRATSSRPGSGPTFMASSSRSGIELPPGEFGIPPEDPAKPDQRARGKGRWGGRTPSDDVDAAHPVGLGRAVQAGGMVYVSSIGPVDPETGQRRERRHQGPDPAVPEEPEGASSRRRAARSTRSSGRTGRCAIRPSSTSSTRSGRAGSPATRRSVRGR